MKILMAVVSDIASDARVRREAGTLAQAGHDVRVVGFDYTIRKPIRRGLDGAEYYLYSFPSRDMPRWQRALRAGCSILRAAVAIAFTRADAFHSHNLHLSLPCVIGASVRRARFIYDAHELVVSMVRSPLQGSARWYERLIWKRSDAVITTNLSRAHYLQRLHGGQLPLVIGNYPVESRRIRAVDLRAQLHIPTDCRILIYQGGFYVTDRCFDTVAEALRDLPHWHWVLVGFGSEHSLRRLRQIAATADMTERMHILPPAPLDRLLDITAECDMGVVPLYRTNLGNYLGDTNKLFEYLMAGIPAIGSDFPEIRHAILDGSGGSVGAVFEPTDPQSITAAIRGLEPVLPELKQRAYGVARERFTWEQEGVKLRELYKELASIEVST